MSGARSRLQFAAHPLARSGLSLASPDLAVATGAGAGLAADSTRRPVRDDRRARAALDRYRRRAAFRPTPHGLWAGVGIGVLGARTELDTGVPSGLLRVSWKRLAELGRALLEDPPVRAHVRLRRAPSVIGNAHTVAWLGPDPGGMVEEKRAARDDLLDVVLRVTAQWTSWARVRAAVAGDQDDDGADDLLLTMIDDRLLHFDLVPPLIGPEPTAWMTDRLAAPALRGDSVVVRNAATGLDRARRSAAAGELAALQGALAALPGVPSDGSGIESTLLFGAPPAPVVLSRSAVAHAADLAPLLFRLQEALAAPIAERTPAAALADALDATTEIFGAGALELPALALGDYGVSPAPDDDASGGQGTSGAANAGGGGGPPAALHTFLVDALIQAARRKSPQVELRAEDLEPLLPAVALPATCELFLTPCPPRAGGPAGAGWLLGLHAPGGATWGRFAFALGDAARPLFQSLRAGEERARPGEQRMDVVFTPSDALGDICAHPPLRPRALALTGWPADSDAAWTLADLELCADATALEPLALRAHDDGEPVAPAALHRVRSTMAPEGVWRLLVGWNLYRQHAPWATTLGALGQLDWTPRLVIDGFVVTPASWRVPPELATRPTKRTEPGGDATVTAEAARAAAVRAWRKRAGLPRFVQVGAEDELLPVDLTSSDAAADLVGQERVFEIWPALDDVADASGRRLEAVVVLVDEPDAPQADQRQAALAATRAAGAVPPPSRGGAAADWHTFKLFGAADRQDPLLLELVSPLIEQARAAGEIEGWFFLRYVEGPGRRPHLRVRVHAPDKRGVDRFGRRLARHLAPALAAADVVATERTGYFPEVARFGGPAALGPVHALFEADSDLVCALLAAEAAAGHDDTDDGSELFASSQGRLVLLVAAFDTMARGLGLDGPSRKALAHRRRTAHLGELDLDTTREHGRVFRRLAPLLRACLTGALPAAVAAPLRKYELQVRRAAAALRRAGTPRVLPPLLHLSAVRLMGLDRAAEITAYDLWARTLESVERHRPS